MQEQIILNLDGNQFLLCFVQLPVIQKKLLLYVDLLKLCFYFQKCFLNFNFISNRLWRLQKLKLLWKNTFQWLLNYFLLIGKNFLFCTQTKQKTNHLNLNLSIVCHVWQRTATTISSKTLDWKQYRRWSTALLSSSLVKWWSSNPLRATMATRNHCVFWLLLV